MTTICLIRHGITDWNHLGKAQGISNIPLNDEGKIQATALANRLVTEPWDIIISSNLKRAKETAQIIADVLGISNFKFDERLIEINCGQIEGTTEDERLNKWGKDWRSLDLGMEKFEDVAKRGIEVIEEIANIYKDKRVIVVSHGALIGLTLQFLLPHVFTKTYIDNTSLTVIKKYSNNWECTVYNCTEHLNA